MTNPDQALLYALSYDEDHVASAQAWLAERPEQLAAISSASVDE